MILQDGPILSDRELKKLKEHKYSSSCNTMLDPTMQKYELLTKPIGQKNSKDPMAYGLNVPSCDHQCLSVELLTAFQVLELVCDPVPYVGGP